RRQDTPQERACRDRSHRPLRLRTFMNKKRPRGGLSRRGGAFSLQRHGQNFQALRIDAERRSVRITEQKMSAPGAVKSSPAVLDAARRRNFFFAYAEHVLRL